MPKVFTIDRAQRKYAFSLDPQEQTSYQFTIETPDSVNNITASTSNAVRNIDITSSNNNKSHVFQVTIGDGQQITE